MPETTIPEPRLQVRTPAMRPRLLDLFCGAGGASMGYHRAGFDVVGVDLDPQPDYPFEFIRADAMTFPLDGFDAVHASPPCQAFSRAALLAERQGGTVSKVDLLTPTRPRLVAAGVPYVIENVAGAPLTADALLCGSMFGLKVRRHRVFESSASLSDPGPCRHKEQGKPVGVYGSMGDTVQGVDTATGRWVVGGSVARTVEEAQEAMGIDWMGRWADIKESIPPAYTEWIGHSLMLEVTR